MIIEAERFIGIKYKKNGRSFRGCDCFGIIYLVWKTYGIDSPLAPYLKEKSVDRWKDIAAEGLQASIDAGETVKISMKDLEPLDMLVFKMPARGIHFGVYIGDDCFIHLMESSRHSTREKLRVGTFWINRFSMALRVVK